MDPTTDKPFASCDEATELSPYPLKTKVETSTEATRIVEEDDTCGAIYNCMLDPDVPAAMAFCIPYGDPTYFTDKMKVQKACILNPKYRG
jgi:hypothetical protein